MSAITHEPGIQPGLNSAVLDLVWRIRVEPRFSSTQFTCMWVELSLFRHRHVYMHWRCSLGILALEKDAHSQEALVLSL